MISVVGGDVGILIPFFERNTFFSARLSVFYFDICSKMPMSSFINLYFSCLGGRSEVAVWSWSAIRVAHKR